MESRLAELEAKISLAEDLLETLNRTVYEQQQQIDLLKREILALRQHLREASAPAPESPKYIDPPNY